MKTLAAWLDEYSESHRNPVNKTLHWLCIPPIVFSVFCALQALPWGTGLLTPLAVVIVLWVAYYLRLSRPLALGALLVFLPMAAGAVVLERALGTAGLLATAATIFVAAWVGQFVGHRVEGARPSFFKDLQFLLIGPLWLLADLYRRLSLPLS